MKGAAVLPRLFPRLPLTHFRLPGYLVLQGCFPLVGFIQVPPGPPRRHIPV